MFLPFHEFFCFYVQITIFRKEKEKKSEKLINVLSENRFRVVIWEWWSTTQVTSIKSRKCFNFRWNHVIHCLKLRERSWFDGNGQAATDQRAFSLDESSFYFLSFMKKCRVNTLLYLRKMLHHHWNSVMSVFRFLVFVTCCLFITNTQNN